MRGTATGVLAAVLAGRTAAQVVSQVTCSADSVWMQNSKQQNPCAVAAFLDSVCNNNQWVISGLNSSSSTYDSPSGANANTCQCNTVVYSLVQACALCQGSTVVTPLTNWTSWCQPSDVHTSYPNSVPVGTVIPGWAYLDPSITGSGSWNATAAKAYAASSASNDSNNGGEKKKVPVGAIVGGVLGGIALILFTAWAIWYAIQRSPAGKGMRVRPATHSDAGLTETVRNDDGEPATKYRVDMSTQVPLMSAYYNPESGQAHQQQGPPSRSSTVVPYGGDQVHYPNYAVTPGAPAASQAYPPYHPPGPYPQQSVPPKPFPLQPQQQQALPPSAFPQNHLTGQQQQHQTRPYATRRLSGGYTGAAEI